MQAKRKLPIGVQTFREIREEGYYYVDKTAYALRLAEEGKHYFLSRPRRFGKSLFLDTLKELFEGNRKLFEGLAAHGYEGWSVRHPVVRLSFASGTYSLTERLEASVLAQLADIAEELGVGVRHDTGPERFRHLLAALHRHTGVRAAVLVDEYDKPILDALETPEIAKTNRDYLRGLYGTVKDADAHIRFSFFTGVSKFAKVSLFSDLNNLIDLTIDPDFAVLCGYTDADLDAVFAPELDGLDREAIREWYNGYGWLGEETVYNPFDVLLLFRRRVFDAHWFETGTPAFLIPRLLSRGFSTPDMERMGGTNALLSAFDVDRIAIEALLFQTGYLTIVGQEQRRGRPYYRLGYPNREVRQSLNESLLQAMLPGEAFAATGDDALVELLRKGDLEGVEAFFRSLFAGIPYNWHVNNEIGDYEGYYASIFYSCFMAAGLEVRAEDATSRGRLDAAVTCDDRVYLFEFKMVTGEPDGSALAQLRARHYADKYRATGLPIHLIGVEFSRKERNLVAFEVAKA